MTVAQVVHCPPGMKPGQRAKVLFVGTEQQCYEWLGRRAWTDPEGVNRGDYGIDLEEEAKVAACSGGHGPAGGQDLEERMSRGKLVAGKRAFAGSLPRKWGRGTIMRQRGVRGEELCHLLYQDALRGVEGMFDPRRSPGIVRAYGWEGRNFVVTLDLTAFAARSR